MADIRITDLIGVWKLKSMFTQLPDERVIHPFGLHPKGQLIYHESGAMSVMLMHAERLPLRITLMELGDWRNLLIKPLAFILGARRLAKAAGHFQSYCGTYFVAGNTVTHCLEVALIPDMVGSRQARIARLQGNNLQLVASDKGIVHTLEWEKASLQGNVGGGE